ncbi:MAG: RidA family protein [Gemmatimonadales bacterium]|jgi:2-iminobutanoate/2-iminopropanoate deaminase|nr:MAG: RidA family protein [Gemmatimonadales bacterium]
MHLVHTSEAPSPAGHYSQAVVHAGTVYVAGLLPFDPARPDAPLGSTEEQARRVLRSLGAVLASAGSGLEWLLQVTVFVSDLSDWGTVNRVFAEFLGEHRPARCVVPVLPLKRGAALELMAIAAVTPSPGA